MTVEFDDSTQYAIGSTSSQLTTTTTVGFRWSEIVAASLRATGVFDTMEDGTTAPADTSVLWMDKNTDPGVLKRYDDTAAEWVAVTYEWFRHNSGADYASRADAVASKPAAPVQRITVLQDGILLSYIRETTDYPALTTADGATWVPDASKVTPMHWGAVGDGSTDDTVAINAMLDWAGAKNSATFTEDFKNTFPAPTEIEGVSGKTFCVSSPLSLTGSHKSLRISNISIKAIGDWSALAIENNFIFALGSLATYVRFERVWLNCNNKSGGIRGRARTRIVGCWFEKVYGIGVEGAGSDVWLVESILGQWTTNDVEYYDPSKYTGILVKITESDMRVTGCTLRWADILIQIESTNNIIQHCHMFNGMKGYLAVDRSAETNTALATYFGSDVSGDDLTRRTEHRGVVVGLDSGAGGKSWASTFDNVYFDNCHHELYVDGIIMNKCKFGAKKTSSLLSESTDTAGLTPYGDAPTIDYWFRLHAYEASCSTQLRLAEPEGYVTSSLRHWVKWIPSGGFSWAADTANISTSTDYNQAKASDGKQLGDGFLLGQKNVHVGDPFQGPLVTYFGLRDNVRIAFMNNSATDPTELRLLADEFQIRPKGTTRFKVDEDRTDVDALSIAGDMSPLNDPLIVLFVGASNIAISAQATGGRRDIPDGVYLWDSKHDSGDYIPGEQFNPAAFGTNPLNRLATDADYANSLALQTCIAVRESTGRPVYGIILAKASSGPENFITDADLVTNGWNPRDSGYDLTAHMSSIRTAIAAVPGSKTRADACFWYATARLSADGPDLWQEKLSVALDTLYDQNLIAYSSRLIAVQTAAGRSEWLEYKRVITGEAAKRTNMSIVETAGMHTPDGTHYSGNGCTEGGRRMAAAVLGSLGEHTSGAIILRDENDTDQSAYTQIHHEGSNVSSFRHGTSGGYTEIALNNLNGKTNFNYDDGTGEVTHASIGPAGSTFAGAVTIGEDPTNALDVATKQYVDAASSGPDGTIYEDRTAAEAANVAAIVVRVGITSPNGDTLWFKRDPSGTALTTADGATWSPDGDVYPDHWAENTTPGTTDMLPAIQAAINTCRVVNLFPETYGVSSAVLFDPAINRNAGIVCNSSPSRYPTTQQPGGPSEWSEAVIKYIGASDATAAVIAASAEPVGTEPSSSFATTIWGLSVHNVTLDAGDAAGFGLYTARVQGLDVVNVKARGATVAGASINGTYSGQIYGLHCYLNPGRGFELGAADVRWSWTAQDKVNALRIYDLHCEANGSSSDFRYNDAAKRGLNCGFYFGPHRGCAVYGVTSENNFGANIVYAPSGAGNIISGVYTELGCKFEPGGSGTDAISLGYATKQLGVIFEGIAAAQNCRISDGVLASDYIWLTGTEPTAGRKESGFEISNIALCQGIDADWSNYRLVNCNAEMWSGRTGSDPSGSFTLSGGLQFGFGASSIEVYEEGEFTPTIYGGTTAGVQTYSTQIGRYTRIGNRVLFDVEVRLSATDGAATGGVRVGGLPFVSENVSLKYSSVSVSFWSGLTSEVSGGSIAPNADHIDLYRSTSGSASTVNASEITSSTILRMTGSYQVSQSA